MPPLRVLPYVGLLPALRLAALIEDRLPTFWRVEQGDALDVLARLPDRRYQACITSPPYFGLRDYGVPPSGWPEVAYDLPGGTVVVPAMESCLGLEPRPLDYIGHLVAVFREVKRVLRDDGLLWVVVGDTYAMQAKGRSQTSGSSDGAVGRGDRPSPIKRTGGGLKNKDLIGVPWLLALALRADGWYLRSDIVWSKLNPMPGSQKDRCTSSHEYVFMLSKRSRYYYDTVAIMEEAVGKTAHDRSGQGYSAPGQTSQNGNRDSIPSAMRTKRDVWSIATAPFPDAHFAVFPPKLVELMVLASTSHRACSECGAPWRRVVERTSMEREGPTHDLAEEAAAASSSGTLTMLRGTMTRPATVTTVGFEPTCDHDDDQGRCVVLDSFAGAGTTGLVSVGLGRDFLGVEMSPVFAEMARGRISRNAPINSAPDPHRSLLT